ncbi:MAG TPA: cysteine hydrolase [Rhodospirillales bacterium]|nr:cysteine hydrolase [Rhodospirillales bacterium]
MHNMKLPQYAIDGALRRRGRIHQFEEIEPTKTALIVIDMQNAFLQKGSPAEVPMARKIVPNINQLAKTLRASGGHVVWVKMTQTADNIIDWSTFFNGVNNPERADRMMDVLSEGSQGHDLWPELEFLDDDIVLHKNRYSAFLPSSSDLTQILVSNNIDTIAITGTVTNVCCESSARDAMMLNFKTIMVSDANAAHTDEEHIASLASVFQYFGDVFSTRELIELIGKTSQNKAVQAA